MGGVLGWFSGRKDERQLPKPPQPPDQPESIKLSVPEMGNSSKLDDADDDENDEDENGPPCSDLKKFS